ncbi:DUF4251 domain-containing protein [Mucilaginibacter sp. UR6-11]|uniref:DUF4251 domain-containing protein n=1 Tax=Mucilaginibacter sp. UR6-11 TaxID=1435644 RepID=UPI001E5FE609|nr:DUF4251 domain-containing protein [Mucilaginibacter sp. UR6-11]MCC8423358.1 DUF4251 domain-containing protein [Mucilaginibacter sp. UR6-11]
MKRFLILLFTIVNIKVTYAQDQPKPVSATDIKKMADDKKFRFNAKMAVLTVSGDRAGASVSSEITQDNHKTLSGPYYALLTPDSVASYLPYFDKSTTEAVGTNSATTLLEDPTKFSTSAYDYSVKEKKDGKVNITIKPKDNSKITKYVFDLAPDGTAKLELTIENYKVITYNGFFTTL